MKDLLITSPQLTELDGKMSAKRADLDALFTKYKNDDGSFKAMPADVREDIQKRNVELAEIGKELESVKSTLAIAEDNKRQAEGSRKSVNGLPGGMPTPAVERKSLGQLVTESEGYKSLGGHFSQGNNVQLDLPNFDYLQQRALKTAGYTIESANGVPTFTQQTNIYVPSAQVVPTIMDFLPLFPMSSDSYSYRRETELINNTGTIAENDGTGLAKSGFKATTIPATAAVIGTYLEITEQQFADVPNFQSILNGRGTLALDLGIEGQVLTGNGVGENLTGLYNTSGKLTYAKGTNTDSNGNAENNADALYHMLLAGRTTGRCNPSLIVINDANWTSIRLMKDANGNYIWGNPATTGGMSIWGVPVLATTNATSGTALSADLPMYVRAGIRQGTTISLEKINDNAIKLLRTLIIYVRMGLEVYRGAAVQVATGLD